MADAAWFTPICDNLLKKIWVWYANYFLGKESASRKWMAMNGLIVDRTTKFAHQVRFKPAEIAHLVRILDALAPTRGLVEDFRKVEQGLRRGRLCPGGEYEVTLNFYRADVLEVLQSLIRAKTGRLKTIEDFAKEQGKEGKDIFEL
jgi:hypothetical protein